MYLRYAELLQKAKEFYSDPKLVRADYERYCVGFLSQVKIALVQATVSFQTKKVVPKGQKQTLIRFLREYNQLVEANATLDDSYRTNLYSLLQDILCEAETIGEIPVEKRRDFYFLVSSLANRAEQVRSGRYIWRRHANCGRNLLNLISSQGRSVDELRTRLDALEARLLPSTILF